jgi:hypothetical protein
MTPANIAGATTKNSAEPRTAVIFDMPSPLMLSKRGPADRAECQSRGQGGVDAVPSSERLGRLAHPTPAVIGPGDRDDRSTHPASLSDAHAPCLQPRPFPAANQHGRIVTVGQLIVFSTETGDAWLLDPADRLAARLARDGDSEPIHIEETDTTFAIGWKGRYRIEGTSFVYADNDSGRVTRILGYPTDQLA